MTDSCQDGESRLRARWAGKGHGLAQKKQPEGFAGYPSGFCDAPGLSRTNAPQTLSGSALLDRASLSHATGNETWISFTTIFPDQFLRVSSCASCLAW